jgi:hypothetical protein
VQLRRVLVLFGLVLGLTALIASVAPRPRERERDAPARSRPSAAPGAPAARRIRARLGRHARVPVRRALTGADVELEVEVPRPGDVVLERLGLRQSADPLAPARFSLVASRPARHSVRFEPVRGAPRIVGRVAFVRRRHRAR